MLSIIVAASLNNGIGIANGMPWHLPEDFKFFKNTTWGFPLIMGRKTFESIGKALPGRKNIVITSNKDFSADGIFVANSLEQAIEIAKEENTKEIFIAGGANVYAQALPLVNKVYLTRVNTTINADAYFPEFNETTWSKTFEHFFVADEKNKFDMNFQIWERQ
jgi:dihydrofolate reductase